MTKSVAGARKAPARKNSDESITIGLKIRNDGGPLFSTLATIKDAHIRCDRVRQLIYLGLMRETELVRPAPVMMSVPFAPLSPTAIPPAQIAAAAQPANEAGDTGVKFSPSDLGEWFSE